MHTIVPRIAVRTRLVAMAGAAAVATLAAACGGSAGSGSPAASSATATPANKLDHCVVGTWRGTGVSGTTSYADIGGPPSLTFSGGAGEVLVIKPDASFTDDLSGAAPQRGAGSDGAAYVVTSTGSFGGTVTTASGELTLTVAAGGTDRISVTKNGAAFRGGSLSGNQLFGYKCSAGKSLTLSEAGLTYPYVPS